MVNYEFCLRQPIHNSPFIIHNSPLEKKLMEKKNKSTYLSFVINNEMFAISVSKVLEVLQKQKIARVPNAPEHVRGVINFRGEIVPVFETRTKFGLPDRAEAEKYVVIVLQLQSKNDTTTIGAVVDAVKDVLTIAESEIKPVPKMSSNFNTEFLDGIAKINDQFTMLLNADKVFLEVKL